MAKRGYATPFKKSVRPLAASKELRNLLLYIRTDQRIVYDEVSLDTVLAASVIENSPALLADWQAYTREHREDIIALCQVLNGRSGQGTGASEAYQRLKDFTSRIGRPPHQWTVDRLWRAYERSGATTSVPEGKLGPPDLLALLRYELGLDSRLMPYRELVQERYRAWLARQAGTGRSVTKDQRWWLDRIVENIATTVRFEVSDLDRVPFTARGGTDGFLRDFGDDRAVAILDQFDQELTG